MSQQNKSEKLTIEEAFDWQHDFGVGDEERAETNARRAVLSASFLLEYLSEGGNTDVGAVAAQGLAAILVTVSQAMEQNSGRRTIRQREVAEIDRAGRRAAS